MMIRWLKEDADMALYTTMEDDDLRHKMDYLLDEIRELEIQRQIDQACRYVNHILFELRCRLDLIDEN